MGSNCTGDRPSKYCGYVNIFIFPSMLIFLSTGICSYAASTKAVTNITCPLNSFLHFYNVYIGEVSNSCIGYTPTDSSVADVTNVVRERCEGMPSCPELTQWFDFLKKFTPSKSGQFRAHYECTFSSTKLGSAFENYLWNSHFFQVVQRTACFAIPTSD